MKKILVILLTTLTIVSYSQVKLKSEKGFIHNVQRWNNGYLIQSQKWPFLFPSKNFIFTYHKMNGEVLWTKEKKFKSIDVETISEENSEYAYVFDYRETYPFSESHLKKDKKQKYIIYGYQVSKDKKFKKFTIKYSDTMKSLMGDQSSGIRLEYTAAVNEGIIGVISKNSHHSVWEKKEYLLFKMDKELNVTVLKLDFTLSDKDWKNRYKSKLQFLLTNDGLAVIQLEKDKVKIHVNTVLVNIENLSIVKSSVNSYTINPNNINILNERNHYIERSDEKVFSEYSYTYFKKDVMVESFTLANLLNFTYNNNKIYANGMLALTRNEKRMGYRIPNGCFTFELNLDNNTDVTDAINTFMFKENHKGSKVSSYFVDIINNEMNCVVNYKGKSIIYKDKKQVGELKIANYRCYVSSISKYPDYIKNIESIVKQKGSLENIYENKDSYSVVFRKNMFMLTIGKKYFIYTIKKQ